VLRIDTVEQQLDDVLSKDRLLATLGTFFAIVGTLLACLGLYGLVNYLTMRRATEIGVRKALGATMQQTLAVVYAEGVAMVFAGLVIGVPLALAATRLLATRLVRVGTSDPFTIAASALVLIVASSAAVVVPAWRAVTIDPAVALRQE
jgi:ABC-type antimicrobial peptide transport system permease subunit